MKSKKRMMTSFACFVLTGLMAMPMVVSANYENLEPLYDENGARNAKYDHDAQPIKNLPLRASESRSIQTSTGGTLTSDVWIGSVDLSGSYNYQVSAKYDRTDHQNIKTTWYGEVYGSNLNFNIGSAGISIGSSSERKETEKRYWENTQSQQDASFNSNGFLCGNWKSIDMYNTASVYGKNLGAKPTEVQSHTSRSK